MRGLLYGRFITPSLFGFHLDIFDLFLTLSSLSFSETLQNNNCRSIYEYFLGESVRASCDFIWGKFVIHSVRFLSGKSFFFVWKIFRADSALFFVFLPCSTIPLFTCFSVLYRILLLFGRSGDGVVVWVLSCCAERFNCGVLFWKTSFLIPNEFLFDYIRNVIVNRMISCAGCERDVVRKCGRELICETSVNRSMGESVCRVFFWNECEQETW